MYKGMFILGVLTVYMTVYMLRCVSVRIIIFYVKFKEILKIFSCFTQSIPKDVWHSGF